MNNVSRFGAFLLLACGTVLAIVALTSGLKFLILTLAGLGFLVGLMLTHAGLRHDLSKTDTTTE